jgi:predicted  nucleic acid-binding Zn-ribbon protein
LNKHLEGLVELSKIDKSVDGFTPQIEAAQRKIAKEQKKVDDVTEKIASLQGVIEENSGKIASYEEQIGTLNEHLKSIQKKNKAITNEKEMKALSMEEELAKEKLTFANEEIERLGKINETKGEETTEQEAALVELNATLETVNAEAQKELAEIEKQKGSLYQNRVEIVSKVDQKILAFYEKVRKWAANTAVVPVKKQACYGCYMKINDKTYSEVIRGDEIVTCSHCGRILYLEKESAEA